MKNLIKQSRWIIALLFLSAPLVFAFGQNQYLYGHATNWDAKLYDIIKPDDPTSFKNVVYSSKKEAEMWDRDANDNKGAWITPESWIFTLTYTDGIKSEMRIRANDFTKTEATSIAEKYGKKMGQIPAVLREGVDFINILKSDALFGGNGSKHSIEITIGETSELYEKTGNIEETLVHESTHAALDYLYNSGWKTDRDKDPKYISKYAAENPNREDISETFVTYLGERYRQHRLPEGESKKIIEVNSHRMKFLDNLKLDLFPLAVKDIDGNQYKIVEIGDQLWMADNLRTTKCNDGTPISRIQIGESSTGAGMYWHSNNPTSDNSKKYGPLYNWPAVTKCDVCPSGWRVPTQDEWNKVLRFWYGKKDKQGNTIYSDSPYKGAGLAYAAKQLRETGSIWPNNESATNSTGFSAVPGGWLWGSNFSYLGRRTAYWSTKNGSPMFTKVADGNNGTWTGQASSKDVLYIRCIKNN